MSILAQSTNFFGRLCARLLPQDCLLCGTASASDILCPACVADLPLLPELHCPQCAQPTSTGERCGRCLAKPPHFDATIATFLYAFPLDRLVQSFKYQHRLAIGTYFGERIAQHLAAQQAIDRANRQPVLTFDRIVPLPLHPQRLRERGFNQALEIARPLERAFSWPIDARSCLRQRHTPAQAGLPWRERAGNVRNAFHCQNDLAGQHIALIDDVMTSGASLDECARTLKLHGAARVTLLVVARTLPG